MKYYGFDPIDISIDRFFALLFAVNKVEYIFSPKTPLELAQEQAELDIQEYHRKRKLKERLGE